MQLKELRRIVTGIDKDGKSYVAMDGPPPLVAQTPHGGRAEMWLDDSVPADNRAAGDPADRPAKLEPPPGGAKFRYFMVAPEDPKLSAEENERIHAERFAAMGASQCRVDTSRHPAMHTTRTVDYIILLSGEVTMLLDKGEVHMKPFDVVIQRGTNHAWVNKGKEPALLVAVLVDAKRL